MKKYLLYIDILGFADLVKNNREKVHYLYEIIDSLNVHTHHSFNTIVFSDTILVYNKYGPTNDDDHRYLSMYSCEFAQDLLYRLIGKEIYFRAVIDYNEFEHDKMKNIERYFGEALINCYRFEKNINSIGLFITDQANKYQTIFPTIQYNKNLHFVFIQQYLYRFEQECQSLEFFMVDQLDYSYPIVREMRIMKDVYEKMYSNDISSKTRGKFQNYWLAYEKKCPWIMNQWKENNFDMNKFIPSEAWENIYSSIFNE